MLSHPNLTPACRRVSLLPKRARRILCGLLLCLLGAANLSAQWTNWRATTVDASLPEQVLDTLSLLPPLLGAQDSISGQSLDARFFTLQNNRLLIDTAALQAAHPGCSRLTLRYRVLPYNLAAPFRRLDTLAIRRPGAPEDDIRYDYSPYTPSKNIWETNSLRSNGAYVRGLSFGNNQNLVFNSNLNLQLDGRLGNDLELSAALSDNSIPLQPDGTTRQLQEFDRIYIQLRRKNTALTAGDYDLTRPQGYFSNYFKRLQGGMVNGSERLSGRDTLTYRAAAAVSRGKFARQIIQGQEGNQGPYRLQGAEGERFIIVLAGTEKVYIDGQLLRRGLDDDYIIDYNLGEVSFTPRRLITKDSRIIVEFEYAVQAYLRATMAGNVEWRQTRGRTYLNVYSEQDSRNSGGAQDLSPEERGRLAQVGDDLSEAFASGVDTLSDYDPARVQYKALDTLICGVLQTILVYSVNTDSARYTARFTEVSQGQGRYVQAFTAANGRVFRWAGFDPITCQPLGNFEPVVKLIAPEGRQLFALGSEYRLGARTQLNAETALSRLDLNRFSPLDSRDDADVAVFAGIRHLLVPDKKGWQMQLRGNYERTGTHFTPLNPYRPAEFIRDWNLGANEAKTAEQLARAELLTQKKGWGSARYEFGSFTRRGLYEGQRHFAQTRLSRGGFEFFGEINALHTASSLDDTRFSRPKFDFSKTLFTQKDSLSRVPFIKIGVYGERERNERRSTGKDTLTQASFWYDLGRLYVQMPEGSGPLQLGASLTHRSDFAPMGALFRQNTAADEINFNGRWQPAGALPVRSISQSVSWNLSWRQLRIIEPELTNQEAQNTYLGRVDYTLSAWKNALNLTTGYEISSGQSPRLEFSYVKVNPGEGQYTWVDRNRDSILQVDEMEIAVFQDQATYVRVAVSTTDYIRTDNVVFNQNLRFEPRVLWAGAKRGWRRVGRRLSTQSTLQINRRVYSGITGISPWNPFDLSIADTALVTVSSTVRNVLFFNRADPAWDASLAQGDSRSRVALTTGFESRRVADWTLHGRLNLGRRWSVEADVALNQKASDNEVFASRDYRLSGWQAGPKVNWLPQRSLRLSLVFSGQNLANSLPSGENATQTDWNLELTWNPAGKSNAAGFRPATALRARATYADVRYTGQPNTPVAYAMLEGLQNGRNYLWGLTLDRQLSKSLQLNLSYEGRKTGEFGRLVHVGRAQVRAVF